MSAFWAKISCLKLAHDHGVHHKGSLYLKACKKAVKELIGKRKKKRKAVEKQKIAKPKKGRPKVRKPLKNKND